MKTLSFCLFLILFFSSVSSAQPANDNVCEALSIILEAPPVEISNLDATVEPGEEAILPSAPDFFYELVCPDNYWCDDFRLHTLWFKFIVPNTGAVNINLCSTFEPQIALYSAEDCSDFSTFKLLGAKDQSLNCTPDQLTTILYKECLTPGETCYVVVDSWHLISDEPNLGEVNIQINTANPAGEAILLAEFIEHPRCPGEANGQIELQFSNLIYPYEIEWSNGANNLKIDSLLAGVYSFTVSDFCDNSITNSYTLVDPTPVETPIVLAELPNALVHPRHCGSGEKGGQLSVPVAQGRRPLGYAWNTGDSIPYLNGLADGNYSLSISDHCNFNDTIVHFSIGATAGPDIITDQTCGSVPIGRDHSNFGGQFERYTYNVDRSLSSGIACRRNNSTGQPWISQNDTWRAFDLANDFGLNGKVDVAGVEVYISSEPNYNLAPGVPVKFTAFRANTTQLDDLGLILTPLDSMETFIPEIPNYQAYFAPFTIKDFAVSDIIVIRVSTTRSGADEHRFDFAANDTPTDPPSETYISSDTCGILTPIALSSFGFQEQIVMDLIVGQPGELSYEWSGNVDDRLNSTPIALDPLPGSYEVTITDLACGLTFIDTVNVTCDFVNQLPPSLAGSIQLFPNPNNGLCTLQYQGEAGKVQIQIYDLQGRQVWQQQLAVENGDSQQLNLRSLAKGFYLTKIIQGSQVLTQRLLIQ